MLSSAEASELIRGLIDRAAPHAREHGLKSELMGDIASMAAIAQPERLSVTRVGWRIPMSAEFGRIGCGGRI